MTEFEVSSAYALAHRTAEHRDNEWRKHFLPMTTPPTNVVVDRGTAFEPFSQYLREGDNLINSLTRRQSGGASSGCRSRSPQFATGQMASLRTTNS